MAKAYFTFCYNGVPHGRHDEHTEVKLGEGDDFLNYLHKYAFAVDTKEPDVAFAELAREPLFRRLLGPVLFGWTDDARLIISSKPDMAQEVVRVDPCAVLRVKTKDEGIYKLPVREIERQCTSAIKFGLNCVGCKYHKPEVPGECYLRLLLKHVDKMGWNPKRFLPPESVPADEFHPPELDNFLVKAVKNGYRLANGYCYVRPRTTHANADLPSRDGKVGYLRFYDTLDLDIQTIEANKERFHERACSAAATRRKQKMCKKECVFAPCGLFSRRGQRSWVDHCLEDQDVPGPYSKERLAQIYRAWMKTFTRMRTPEEIAFIAYNAGKVTHVFGCELTLAGMDKNLDLVEFVGYRGKYSKFFSFEDALEILRTPWNRGGRDYGRVHLHEAPEMSEEQLWAYAEIRQRDYTPPYSYWGGVMYMQAEPRVISVEWTGYGSFTIKCHCGWNRTADGVEGVADIFGIDHTIRTSAKRLALEAAGCLESNPDTQP